jgi:hypothetical protein
MKPETKKKIKEGLIGFLIYIVVFAVIVGGYKLLRG